MEIKPLKMTSLPVTCSANYQSDNVLFSFTESSLKQEGGLQDVPIEVIHLLLSSIFKCKDNFGIATEQKEIFIKTLKKGKVI